MVKQKWRSPAEELCHEDHRCIFAVHGIQRFGFRASRILRDHYSAFGTVLRVCISTSRAHGHQTRPGNFGLVLMTDSSTVTKILQTWTHQTISGETIKVEACRRVSKPADEPCGDLQDSDIRLDPQATRHESLEHHNIGDQSISAELSDTSELPIGPCSSSGPGPADVTSVNEEQVDALNIAFRSNLASCLTSLASFGPRCEQGHLTDKEELSQLLELARLALQGLHIFSQQLMCGSLNLSSTSPCLGTGVHDHASHLLTTSMNRVADIMSELESSDSLSLSHKQSSAHELAMAAQGVISAAQDVMDMLENDILFEQDSTLAPPRA